MQITNIKPNKANPRIIKNDQFKKLVQSLTDFPEMMALRPIIVDENMIIQGGNMRYRALLELGYKDIPDEWVKQGKDLTPEQWKEFVIKDNLSFGEWDFDMLAADYEIEELQNWGFEVPEFLDDLAENKAEDDHYDMPEPEEVKTDIQLGDIFQIGPHRLICGDSTSSEDAAKLFKENKADLVITDPPYNVNYEGGTGLKIKNDNMSDSKFYNFLFDFYKNIVAFTKDGGAWYVWHADSEGVNFRKAFQDAGLELKQCLIWVKNAMVMGRQDYQWRHEPCLYGWKPGKAHHFIADRSQTTVIDDKINLKKLSKDEMLKMLTDIFSDKTPTSVIYHDKPLKNDVHPTIMKPVTLMGYLMNNSSKPLDLVADPFLGSGSTMVAAHQLGRRCYGMELDPVYCAVILDRMHKLDPSLPILRNGEPYTPESFINVKGK